MTRTLITRTLMALAAASALSLPATAATAAPFSTQVRVEGGTIAGETQGDVAAFKGIPFAAPPLGRLRWRAPQPVAPWTGVRSAKAYGHDCMQKPVATDAAPLGTTPDEDCLVLNVWRPAQRSAGKLPVMVWIYGGGLVNGGSSPAVYDGSAFAKQGIVFVSMNYRLGRFGFFAHPALTREAAGAPVGNYGYMDQIAALKWVRKNIAAFGGDPADVTVFGESSGGASVHMLLTSPLAKGLVQRAMIESGGGRGGFSAEPSLHDGGTGAPSAESIGVAFARQAGVTGEGAEALAALRALPADTVLGGVNMVTSGAAAATYSGPMRDGQIVVESTNVSYQAGRFAKIPLVIGGNSADIGRASAKTTDEFFASFGADAAAARKAYDPEGTGNLRAILAKAGMDRTMLEPARFVAATYAEHGVKSWEFRFSYVATSLRARTPGATHASEIPFVFDTVAAKYGPALSAQDEAMAKTVNRYWADFAKTGDPNGSGLPVWPRYDPKRDVIVDFTNQGAVVGPDPWKARMDLTEKTAPR